MSVPRNCGRAAKWVRVPSPRIHDALCLVPSVWIVAGHELRQESLLAACPCVLLRRNPLFAVLSHNAPGEAALCAAVGQWTRAGNAGECRLELRPRGRRGEHWPNGCLYLPQRCHSVRQASGGMVVGWRLDMVLAPVPAPWRPPCPCQHRAGLPTRDWGQRRQYAPLEPPVIAPPPSLVRSSGFLIGSANAQVNRHPTLQMCKSEHDIFIQVCNCRPWACC